MSLGTFEDDGSRFLQQVGRLLRAFVLGEGHQRGRPLRIPSASRFLLS